MIKSMELITSFVSRLRNVLSVLTFSRNDVKSTCWENNTNVAINKQQTINFRWGVTTCLEWVIFSFLCKLFRHKANHKRRHSSCQMSILRNNNHGKITRVCSGIFTTALRNKEISQILTKNTSPYFHSALLVIWPLTTLKGTHFSELSNSRFSGKLIRARECKRVHLSKLIRLIYFQ